MLKVFLEFEVPGDWKSRTGDQRHPAPFLISAVMEDFPASIGPEPEAANGEFLMLRRGSVPALLCCPFMIASCPSSLCTGDDGPGFRKVPHHIVWMSFSKGTVKVDSAGIVALSAPCEAAGTFGLELVNGR